MGVDCLLQACGEVKSDLPIFSQNKTAIRNGFTLLELMVVLVIIGIFSALAIPGIMEIRYRNTLTDSVERIRTAAGATRDFAMQTRKAAVIEVTSAGVWVNILSDAACESDVETRCAPNLGGFMPLYDADSLGAVAGVALCGGAALRLDPDALTCEAGPSLDSGDGFALCYSGAGELFYRSGADANTGCSGSNPPAANGDDWKQSCSVSNAESVEFVDESSYGLSDGAALMLNRYPEGSACGSAKDALDMRRLVIFPTNGSPYSQVGGAEGASGADTDTN